MDQGGERSGSHWSLEWDTFCGKGRFAVGVAQRLRAGEPAPDPRSVFVRPSHPWTGQKSAQSVQNAKPENPETLGILEIRKNSGNHQNLGFYS